MSRTPVPNPLDAAVTKYIKELLTDSDDEKQLPNDSIPVTAVVILNAVVAHSDDMNPKYGKGEVQEGKQLIRKNHPWLGNMLQEAWKAGCYGEIRNLEILQRPKETAATVQSPSVPPDALYQSFTSPYRGVAVDGFYEYLRANNKAFRTDDKVYHPIYYGQFCSIVQSSGTGKSRLMFELRNKGAAVLYMNIRPANEKQAGFPARDRVPAEILAEDLPTTGIEYGARCCAFFTALFRTLQHHLSHLLALSEESTPAARAAQAIEQWNNRMCDLRSQHRDNFFKKVQDEFAKVLPSFKEDAKKQAVTLKDATTAMQRLSLDDKAREREAASQMPGSATMMKAYTDMVKALPALFGADGKQSDDRLKLLIGMDEAHRLSVVHSADGHTYRPSTIVCRAISLYSAVLRDMSPAIWVGFASTSSKAGDFAAPQDRSDSARIYYDGKLLYPPYCQLGWDQFADGLNDIRATEVAKARHIIGYGRALWKSISGMHNNSDALIRTAIAKLAGSLEDDKQVVLSVLSQRFALAIAFGHREAVDYVERAVASNMRVCLATTEDRRWIFTTYPSEPFLSCAAAAALHRGADSFSNALQVLKEKVGSGMVDIGKCGELASRLLWLSAKDLYVRTQHTGNFVPAEQEDAQDNTEEAWDVELVHCQMIPVVQFFRFVFGARFWTTVPGAQTAFENAYINFSHWVSMDVDISPSKVGNPIKSDEWTLRHWHRTAAVQCCHGQPLVDKMVPIYFKDQDGNDFSRMSQIFISDKAGRTVNKDTLNTIQRQHPSIDCESSKPWIAILVDLGLQGADAVSATFPMRSSERDHSANNPTSSCLRIYAAGLSVKTYPFLEECPVLHGTLRFIVDREVIPAADKMHARFLQQQLNYGKTRTEAHMKWEDWSGTGPIPQ